MRGKRPVNTEKRTVSTLLRRRIGVVVGLVFVWATVMFVVLYLPYTKAVQGKTNIRTSYGALRWVDVTDYNPGVVGKPTHVTRIHPVVATMSMTICIAATLFTVVYGNNTLRNLTPYGRCNNCGYDVHTCRSGRCPECGELPNRHW